jgi:hypothetical protein
MVMINMYKWQYLIANSTSDDEGPLTYVWYELKPLIPKVICWQAAVTTPLLRL